MAEFASVALVSVVLVHGGFVDGSGWEDVYRILKKDGYNVSIVQAASQWDADHTPRIPGETEWVPLPGSPSFLP